jgi:hypothetical protein
VCLQLLGLTSYKGTVNFADVIIIRNWFFSTSTKVYVFFGGCSVCCVTDLWVAAHSLYHLQTYACVCFTGLVHLCLI